MPTLTASQTAALEGPGPRPWVCDIEFPGPDQINHVADDDHPLIQRTWYVSKVGFAIRGVGARQYRPLVLEYDYPRYGPSDSGGSVAGVEMSITIDDSSRELMAVTEGSETHQIEGSPVTIREAGEDLQEDEWLPIFVGVIISIDRSGSKAVIRCRTDDTVMKHDSPRSYARIPADAFPNADPAAWNTIARPIYGEHNSAGYTDHGMISCLSVDRVNYIYLVSIGRCLDVPAVFIDDTRLTVTTHYTWGYIARRGVWYTVIYITATGYSFIYGSAWSGGTTAEKLVLSNRARITADVLGFESTGIGIGAIGGTGLIANPIDQLVHYLSNFVLGSWRRGPWLATHERIEDFTDLHDFFEDHSAVGARVISDSGSAYTQISEWLTGEECVAWWTPEGKLAFSVDDFTDTNIYPAGPPSIQEKLELPKPDDQLKTNTTRVEFVHDENNGKFHASVTAQDPDAVTSTDTTISQTWGSAK